MRSEVLARAFGPEPARAFLAAYAGHTDEPPDRHWLVTDAVGFSHWLHGLVQTDRHWSR